MKYSKQAVELADFIEANPEVKFEIDNDGWHIARKFDDEPIADSDQYQWDTNWYSGSNCYGAGLAEAMVILLNKRGFNIEASAV